jgi:hypothetical protein
LLALAGGGRVVLHVTRYAIALVIVLGFSMGLLTDSLASSNRALRRHRR